MAITTLLDGKLEATVDSFGAELKSLKFDGREYLWQGDATWWSGTNPVLFPIVGNLRNDAAQSSAGPVQLKRHGLARIFEHKLTNRSSREVSYELGSTDETKELYPFDFLLEMSYSLTRDGIEEQFKVTNTGNVDLPFVVGAHPAFNVPLDKNVDEAFEDYELRFTHKWSASSALMDNQGLLDFENVFPVLEGAKTLPLSRKLFKHNTVILEDVPDNCVTLIGTKSGHGVSLEFEDFRWLGIWSANETAPFVAVEPWCGCATALDEDDKFENKRGMISLKPKESITRTMSISVF